MPERRAFAPAALVYSGPGAARFSMEQARHSLAEYFRVSTCTAEDLADGALLDGASLLVMPGGRDVPYHEALCGRANQQIRRFVELGGTYLGFCAGAYYGARRIAFDRGGLQEILADRELEFFDGTAEGPIFGKPYVENAETGAEAARITLFEEELHAYYNGGCCFIGADTRLVAGYYRDSKLSTPAVLCCRHGAGRAILSGVHLEYSFEGIQRLKLPRAMEVALESSDLKRRRLLHKLLGSP